MRPESLLTAFLALPAAGIAADSPPSNARPIIVRETAGIRRGNFPVNVQVQVAKGRLRDAAHVRLLLGEQEVPLQASADTRWPDGSVRALDLNFNASIGPLAELRYQLEFGNAVQAQPIQNERLEIVESGGSLQVGKVRLGPRPDALLESIAFGREIAGDGLNAASVTDAGGHTYLLDGDASREVVKPGPLTVQIRYRGAVHFADGYAAPYTITISMPNSKSWVKYSVEIDDPELRIREIAFNTSLKLGAFPWTWDFGTGSWSYGSLRSAGDSAVLVQTVGSTSNDWQISTGARGAETLYERAAGARPTLAEGWGHLQDSQRAVAFAIEDFGLKPGRYAIELDGSGQLQFRFSATHPSATHSIAVYQHYVASPVPIGAATSPVAMSSPLVVSTD